jgi:CheY-like chemotaxis protein
MKILVVHRQKMVVDQIKSVLDDNLAVVVYHESGLDGLLTSRFESFDLIICGTDLPVVTGFEIARARKFHLNKNIPVIFIADTANPKIAHLAGLLGVVATVDTQDVREKLADIVYETVKV